MGKVEFEDYTGLFRGRLILPLHYSCHYSLDQHGISSQNFYFFDSAIGRDQQFNAGASDDVVSFGQLGINRIHPVLDFARVACAQEELPGTQKNKASRPTKRWS